MTLTLRQILNAVPAFQKLINTDLSAKMRFRATRFVKQIRTITEDYEEQRKRLIEKHGVLNERGVKEVMPEQFEAFQKEYIELVDEPIEIKEEDLPNDIWDNVVMSLSDEENIKPFKKVKE
ncbi:MAG: hypothetical protein WC356_06550 [Candidatus Micrarchaeia archaeon]|jgi:type IV secretory pathway TrbF-like protein